MLKNTFVSALFIFVLVFSSSHMAIQFPQAEASSDLNSGTTLLISELQTRSIEDAHEEFVELYNPMKQAVDITGWELQYRTASGESWSSKIRSVQHIDPNYVVPPESFYVLATENFSSAHDDIDIDRTLSSGSAESGGHIRLVKPVVSSSEDELSDEAWVLVDSIGWGTAEYVEQGTLPAEAPPRGLSISRCFSDETMMDTGDNSVDFILGDLPVPGQGLDCPTEEADDTGNGDSEESDNDEASGDDVTDDEFNDDDNNAEESNDEEEDTNDEAVNPFACESVVLSELLPNPEGPRYEHPREDHAYIELYNPTNETVSLYGCGLQTSSSSTEYRFEEDEEIDANSYTVFYERKTGVQLPVSPSGTAYLLSYTHEDTEELQEATYPADMPEAASWSWFGNDTWDITYAITPGASNEEQPLRSCLEGQKRNPETNRCRTIENQSSASSLVPCLEGQERNPETNRCRTIGGARQLVPCEPHQERNPETNRCRNINQTRQLTPCAEGQERNPETNRCRSVNSATSDLVPCAEGQERNPETNRCRTVATENNDTMGVQDVAVATTSDNTDWLFAGVIVAAVLLYGMWEWRIEMKRLLSRTRRAIALRGATRT